MEMLKHYQKSSLKSGFTLVEIGMVMALIAIIIAFAIPNFKPLVTSSKVEQSVQLLTAELRRARQEAYENSAGNSVTVTFTKNGTQYQATENGSMLFTKNLESGCVFTDDTAEEAVFDSNGSPVSAVDDIEVKVSDTNGNNKRSVFIRRGTGRVEFN
ncbi:MAG: Tfp pilus assembly protein FimT/FimU [Solirubrobacterales bacterium]